MRRQEFQNEYGRSKPGSAPLNATPTASQSEAFNERIRYVRTDGRAMDGRDIDEQEIAGTYLVEPFLLYEKLIEGIGHLNEL